MWSGLPSKGSEDTEKVSAQSDRRLDTFESAAAISGRIPAGHIESLFRLRYKVEVRGAEAAENGVNVYVVERRRNENVGKWEKL